MRRWWLLIALLLSVGLNLGILVAIGARLATRPPRREPPPEQRQEANPPGDPVQRISRLADHLRLEGETRRRFIDLQWNLFQETTRLRLQLGEVHRETRKELTRGEADRQKIDRLLAESSRLYLALERTLVDNVYATRGLLGPEKEREYLKMIGRLRVPNPGPGIANPAAGPPPRRPMLERFRERRRQRFGEREGEGPPPEGEEGPPPGEEEPNPPPPPPPG
jgi:hypothetical protein